MRKRVIAAMSGGVDSSVMAAMLVEQGHEVVGVTLNVEPRQVELANVERADACCSLSSVEDARRVADRLGIPHYALNFRDIFRERVIDDFIAEYRRGRTPNPCVRCNQHIKFEAVLNRLHALDADAVATGHFARLEDGSNGRRVLRRGVDTAKDQSYVLYPLGQDQLRRTRFPLGSMTKDEVRARARALGLITADKPESQEICFVVDNNYGGFVERAAGRVEAGPILDRDGRELGEHRGLIYYTVGQRRGLGLNGEAPLYVLELDTTRNALVVGPEDDLYRPGLVVSEVNWVSIDAPSEPLEATVKIRYRAPDVPCVVEPLSGQRARILFQTAQKAVTPGQAAVLYQGDMVLAGGTIECALSAHDLREPVGAEAG